MAASVMCQSLSSASHKLLQSCRLSLTHGHISRTLSTNNTTALTGSNRSEIVSGAIQTSYLTSPSSFNYTKSSKKTVNSHHPALLLFKSECLVEQALSRLTLSPLEVRLGSNLAPLPKALTPTARKVILDPSPFTLLRECPTASKPRPALYDPAPSQEIRLPDSSTRTEKRASNILQKRRRKMNRHQYLKWKKRNKFKLRIHKHRSRKKKRAKWERHLAKFRFAGLKPGEGEEYLAKKRAKLDIYLRYLGIDTDKDADNKKRRSQGQQVLGKITPEPMLPEGAKMR